MRIVDLAKELKITEAFILNKKFEFIEYNDAEYNEELERIRERFTPLIKICKEYGTAMRIGVAAHNVLLTQDYSIIKSRRMLDG